MLPAALLVLVVDDDWDEVVEVWPFACEPVCCWAWAWITFKVIYSYVEWPKASVTVILSWYYPAAMLLGTMTVLSSKVAPTGRPSTW